MSLTQHVRETWIERYYGEEDESEGWDEDVEEDKRMKIWTTHLSEMILIRIGLLDPSIVSQSALLSALTWTLCEKVCIQMPILHRRLSWLHWSPPAH